MKRVLIAIALVMLLVAVALQSQTPAPKPGPEHKKLENLGRRLDLGRRVQGHTAGACRKICRQGKCPLDTWGLFRRVARGG